MEVVGVGNLVWMVGSPVVVCVAVVEYMGGCGESGACEERE